MAGQGPYSADYPDEINKLTPPNHRTPIFLNYQQTYAQSLQWDHDNFFSDYANGSNYPFWMSGVTYNKLDRVIALNNSAYECQADGVLNVDPINNVGFAVGTYSFVTAGGTDDLQSGGGINMSAYSGPDNNAYFINIGLFGDRFNWADGFGHFHNDVALVPGDTYQLSYGVTVTWGGGSTVVNDYYYWTVSTSQVFWWLVNPDYRGVRPQTNFNGQKLVLEGILNQYFNNNSQDLPVVFRQPSSPFTDVPLPDIYIQNNTLENFIFISGWSEQSSSWVGYTEVEDINYVQYDNTTYNFDGDAFTIFVPAALYFILSGGTSVATIVDTGTGGNYLVPPSVTIVGGGGTGAIADGFIIIPPGPLIVEGGEAIGVGDGGTGYTSQPQIVLTGGTGSGWTGYAVPTQNLQGDSAIRVIANRFVISGMLYNILVYTLIALVFIPGLM